MEGGPKVCEISTSSAVFYCRCNFHKDHACLLLDYCLSCVWLNSAMRGGVSMRYNTDATARGSQDVRSGGRLGITPQVRQKSSRTERRDHGEAGSLGAP